MQSKKIKSKADLPEWFKSKRYKSTLSPIEWHNSIFIRYKLKQFMSSLMNAQTRPMVVENGVLKTLENRFMEMLNDSMQNQPGIWILEGGVHPPVQDLPILDALFFSCLPSEPEYMQIRAVLENLMAEARKNTSFPYLDKASNHEFAKFVVSNDYAQASIKLLAQYHAIRKNFGAAKEYLPDTDPFLGCWDLPSGTPVTINLQYDDETILASVRGLLTKAREQTGVKAKKPFGQKDFDEWSRCRVLQLHDLDMWSMITQTKITDGVIAKALWPDDDVDAEDITPVDLLRKTARKKVDEVIRRETINRLKAQLFMNRYMGQATEDE